MLAAALTLLAGISLSAFGASPARADRCDDIAAQLKGQIEGLKIGITAANVIYLSHPQARELTLGCRGRNYSNELYAKADSRKPKPEFFELVATAANRSRNFSSWSPPRRPSSSPFRSPMR